MIFDPVASYAHAQQMIVPKHHFGWMNFVGIWSTSSLDVKNFGLRKIKGNFMKIYWKTWKISWKYQFYVKYCEKSWKVMCDLKN